MTHNPLTIEELWNALHGAENALRHYADLVGSIGLTQTGGADSIVQGVRAADALLIRAEWWNLCKPPWCKKRPVTLHSEISQLPERIEAIVNVTKLLIAQLPNQNERLPFYNSEVPGTHWKEAHQP